MYCSGNYGIEAPVWRIVLFVPARPEKTPQNENTAYDEDCCQRKMM